MKKLSEIDRNFSAPEPVSGAAPEFRPLDAASPLCFGLLRAEGRAFCRMPPSAAARVSGIVSSLCGNTAGGRLMFRTNSRVIALRVRCGGIGRAPHLTMLMAAGFDLYCREHGEYRFRGCFAPPFDLPDGGEYESLLEFPDAAARDLLLHFPLYADVTALSLGLERGASLSPAGGCPPGEPVVFYGSSITQGACASRPGLCFTNLLSRRLGCGQINLGFSGGARAEPAMADYLASLPMRALVLDYDHNAESAAELRASHGAFFRRIREARPDLPIVLASSPRLGAAGEWAERREIIRRTWREARERGDENVRFVDGSAYFTRSVRDDWTVDGRHPGDLGMRRMADAFCRALSPAAVGR